MHGTITVVPSLRHRRRSRLSWASAPGVAIAVAIAVAALCGGAGAAYWWWASAQPVATEACYGVVAAAVDTSDPATPVQLQRIRERLERVPGESCIGTRVMVHQFNPVKDEPVRELFDEIDPGKYSEHSKLSKSRLEVEEPRQQHFVAPLRAQLERALIPDSRPESFLIEGLSYLSRSSGFKGDDPQTRKKMIVVTDFIQNSPGCSFYKEARRKGAKKQAVPWAKRCHRVLEDNPALFRGADVEVMLIRRPRAKDGTDLQPAELREFYEDWFRAAGARSVITKDVP